MERPQVGARRRPTVESCYRVVVSRVATLGDRRAPGVTRGILVRYPRLIPKHAESAKLLAKRTLTNLYNERPTWLGLAHRKLDEAVFAAYGWKPNLTDAQILERLLALNRQRAAR